MIFSPASSHISIRWVKRVRVFMPGRPATVMVWPRCWRALGLRQGGGRYGGTTMAKILNEALLFKLSPSVRPDPLALADRDRREELREQQSLTAAFFGDPLPGMSALDRRRRNEVAH
jgi:hypothetical protein